MAYLMRARSQAYWLPRSLHPGAWWIWALCLAVAASRTTNPLILGSILAIASFVVISRRGEAPWARMFRLYVILGALIIVIRVFFRIVFGGAEGPTVLFTLPEIPLPPWVGGIRLFGSVSAESLLGGLYDGLRLATMVICIGAANALANPKRLLKAVPGALYEVGTAVVVALSVFPQLAESVLRVRRARRLRGGTGKGVHALRTIIIPVLADALDRSLLLAAAMDSRGYGRTGHISPRIRLLTGFLTIAGLLGVCVGIYGVLDGTAVPADSPRRHLGVPMLACGLAVAMIGFVITGRRVSRTRFRPDRWRLAEIITVACGLAVAVGMFRVSSVNPADLNPSLNPLQWPEASATTLLGVLVGVLPAWLTPPPPLNVEQASAAMPTAATRGRSKEEIAR